MFGCIFYANYRSLVARHRKSPVAVIVPSVQSVLLEYASLMLSMMTICYFMVSRSALTVFDCVSLVGTDKYVLKADPSEFCYEPGTWQQVCGDCCGSTPLSRWHCNTSFKLSLSMMDPQTR